MTEKQEAPKKVTVILLGNSHGGKAGDKRQTDEKHAHNLVSRGLARYAAAK